MENRKAGTVMSQVPLPLKIETVAEVIQLESGALVIRPRPGRKLPLTAFAETRPQADGSVLLSPLSPEIEMDQAAAILGVPYTTLRRIVEMGILTAWKRSQGRWTITLDSVLDLKKSLRDDPEFWDKLKAQESGLQGCLKL